MYQHVIQLSLATPDFILPRLNSTKPASRLLSSTRKNRLNAKEETGRKNILWIKDMSRSSAPLWQVLLSTFGSSWGCACVLPWTWIREATGATYEFIPGFAPVWRIWQNNTSDSAMPGSKQDQLLWCIRNLIGNPAFVVIVEPPWARYCIVLDSFSPFSSRTAPVLMRVHVAYRSNKLQSAAAP